MNRLVSFGVAAVLLASTAVWAAPAKDEAEARKAIEARSAHFKEMGKAMEPIGNMLRRKAPYDAAVVEKQSAQIVELAKKIPPLYEVDTRKFPDIKTEAVEGIWASQADFNSKADGLVKAATELNGKSKGGGSADTFTKDAAAVGKACSSCHDNYRVKKTS